MNCVPRLRGSPGDPHCRFVGVVGFLPGITRGCREAFKESLSLLKFNALWEFSSQSSSSSLFVMNSEEEGDFIPVDILADISPGNEDATRLAAAKELADTAAAMAAAE